MAIRRARRARRASAVPARLPCEKSRPSTTAGGFGRRAYVVWSGRSKRLRESAGLDLVRRLDQPMAGATLVGQLEPGPWRLDLEERTRTGLDRVCRALLADQGVGRDRQALVRPGDLARP